MSRRRRTTTSFAPVWRLSSSTASASPTLWPFTTLNPACGLSGCSRKNQRATPGCERSSATERMDSEFLRLRESWSRLIEDAGLQYNFVASQQIESGDLIRSGYRVLVLPRSTALSAKESQSRSKSSPPRWSRRGGRRARSVRRALSPACNTSSEGPRDLRKDDPQSTSTRSITTSIVSSVKRAQPTPQCNSCSGPQASLLSSASRMLQANRRSGSNYTDFGMAALLSWACTRILS